MLFLPILADSGNVNITKSCFDFIWAGWYKSSHILPLHRWHCSLSALNSCKEFLKCCDFWMFLLCVTAHLTPCLMLRELANQRKPCAVSSLLSFTKAHTELTSRASRSCTRRLLEPAAPGSLTCVRNYFSSIWRLWSRQLKKWELQTLPSDSVTDARRTVASFPALHAIGTVGTLWKKAI